MTNKIAIITGITRQVCQSRKLQIEAFIHDDILKLTVGFKIDDLQGQVLSVTNAWPTHQIKKYLNYTITGYAN